MVGEYWQRLRRFFFRFGSRELFLWYGLGLAFGVLLFRFSSPAGGILWMTALVIGHLLQLSFLIIPGRGGDDTRIRLIIRELAEGGEYSLHQLAGKTGLKAHAFEQQLQELMALEVFTLAYYPPEKRVYIPRDGRGLAHCPRCATDLGEKGSGRCPNCRLRFSRIILEEPYRYI